MVIFMEITRVFKSDWEEAKWLLRCGNVEVLLFEEIQTFNCSGYVLLETISLRIVDRRPHARDILLMVDGADIKLFDNDRFARVERDGRVVAMVFSDVKIQFCPEAPEDDQ